MITINSKQKKLIVVVPAYNEADRVVETIRSIFNVTAKLATDNVISLIYVVDDGSTDNTYKLACEAGANRVLRHRVNQGLGAAIRTGLLAARADEADIVVKLDADLQHDPGDIFALIRPILDDYADVVYGNRFEGITYKMAFVRRIGNTVFTILMRWLTRWPLKDSQPGIFAVNRAYIEVFYFPGDYNYTQQILLDAYHKGMRFAHVPVVFRERVTGKSFVSLKYPLKVLPQIVMILVSIKPMRLFAPMGFFALTIGGVVFFWELGLWFMGITNKPVIHVYAILGLLMFGLQTLFFGILAQLIVQFKQK